VPASVVSLAGYYVMATAGAVSLIWKMKMADVAMRSCAPIGAALTFLALLSGAVWGKPTWGTWWIWDARNTSMLVLLFLYLGVTALYQAFDREQQAAKACAVLSLVGTVNIPIIYKSVDWWFTLHQPATIKIIGESSIHADMKYPLFIMIAAFYLLFAVLMLLRCKAEILERERSKRWIQDRVAARVEGRS
jgi:heme exporter protein C